jgi:hypothetical protein
MAVAPDVVLCSGESNIGLLQQASRAVPIVLVEALIRSAADLWRACRDRAVTRPGSRISNSARV